MPSPLRSGDHYVLRKLCDELLPWMIGGRRLTRQWFVRLAWVYGYGGDLAAALAGLGIGAPVAALATGKVPDGKNALAILHDALPGYWFVVGGVALVAWVILRLVVQRENAVARALLARDVTQSMKALYAELWRALAEADPMPKITEIQKAVDGKVQDAIRNSLWQWDPPPPPETEIGDDLKSAVDQIRATFMARWAPPPAGVL